MADDKKFYWIKLKTDFFQNETIDWLQDQPNGCKYIVLYLRLCLLTANTGGILHRKIGELIIPYDYRKISELTHIDIDSVMVALNVFEKIGLICTEQNGTIHIPEVPMMTGFETKWAKYKRDQREKKRLDIVQNVSNELSSKSIENRDKSIEIREEEKKRKKKENTVPPLKISEEVKQAFVSFSGSTNLNDLKLLSELEESHGKDRVLEAMGIAEKRGSRRLSYVKGILQNWARDGYDGGKEKEEPWTPEQGHFDALAGLSEKDRKGWKMA